MGDLLIAAVPLRGNTQFNDCRYHVLVCQFVIYNGTIALDHTVIFQRSDRVGDFCFCCVQHNRQLRVGESGVLLQ